jgi:hypothetical protein
MRVEIFNLARVALGHASSLLSLLLKFQHAFLGFYALTTF